MTIPESRSRLFAKTSEFGGKDRPETGVHDPSDVGNIVTSDQALRLTYLTGDASGTTTKIDPFVFNGETADTISKPEP